MAAVPSLSIHDFLLSSVITASSSSPNASERGGNAATTTTGTIPFPAIIIIDVRTPSEYEQGHIPNAINIPLFTNEERVEVGTLYKQHSRTVAIRRGLELVSPRIMTHLASQLLLVSQQQQQPQPQQPNIPYLYIYCHRGGMRSASVAWLAQNLLHIPNVITLIGGYKSYRRHVLDLFNDDDDDDDSRNNQTTSSTTTTYSYTWPQIHLLGGRAGCGKTDILLALRDNNNNHERSVAVVDLEGLANHRGSSYGSVGLKNNNQQPTVEQFENNLHDTILPMLLMMKNNSTVKQQIWLENENIMIGQCRIPTGLWNRMKVAPMVTIHRTFEERVSYLVSIYVNNTDDGGVVDGDDVIDNDNDHSNNNGDATTNTTTTSVGTLLSDATRRISKRLGHNAPHWHLRQLKLVSGMWHVVIYLTIMTGRMITIYLHVNQSL
jgi:tRNA 2-selenouridine synthase